MRLFVITVESQKRDAWYIAQKEYILGILGLPSI